MNGSVDDGDLGVVALISFGHAQCTGTLVAPRVVLTAAHCLTSVTGQVGEGVQVFIGSAPDEGGEELGILHARTHPEFDRTVLSNDVQLLLLDRAAPADAIPWPLAGPLDQSFVGAPLRLVGFGHTAPDDDESHRKHEGASSITAVRERELTYAPDPATTCLGDSGGPVFLTVGDEEVLAGVTSRGDPDCAMSATAIRLDVVSDFVESYVASTAEGAARPGERCHYPEHCAEGLCLETADEPTLRFCSVDCEDDGDCPASMKCESEDASARCWYPSPAPGALGAQCERDSECEIGSCVTTDDDEPAACRLPCQPELSGSCPSGSRCVEVGAAGACVPRPPDDDSCSAAPRSGGGGSWALPVLIAIAFRRLRHRRARGRRREELDAEGPRSARAISGSRACRR